MTTQDQSVGSLLKDLIDQVGDLVRQELRLARAETSEKISQAQVGIVSLLAGLLTAFCALLILLQAVVIALSNIIPPSLASIVVGVVVAIVAFVLIKSGQQQLSAKNLVPERTIRSVQEDKDLVVEKAR